MTQNCIHKEIVEVCGEGVCAKCFEDTLMTGPPKFAPRHATIEVVHFDTIHMQNYRKQIERGKKNATNS